MNITQIKNQIFSITESNFESICLDIFKFQAHNNPLYRQYVNLLRKDIESVDTLLDIPFLPISFFKTHTVITQEEKKISPVLCFESSTTTGNTPSKHHLIDPTLYQNSFLRSFEQFIGSSADYCILGLLPSYLERGNSSLVYMVNHLITLSQHPDSGFYLYNHDELYQKLQHLEETGQDTILFGTTHALLDFAETHSLNLNHTRIIETGGMKGRREELSREAVHHRLMQAFKLSSIYSEYGMTELLSQAYSKSDGIFNSPAWMKVLVRDINDPMTLTYTGKGAINIIDLANIYSCVFIATDDYGLVYQDGTFQVEGRIQHTEIRGCSLMTI
jgi:phenylacetate-coenzyme A ligase PaaK-like adenylate-forming protein